MFPVSNRLLTKKYPKTMLSDNKRLNVLISVYSDILRVSSKADINATGWGYIENLNNKLDELGLAGCCE